MGCARTTPFLKYIKMKIEKKKFYVIENFTGTGVDEFGNEIHRKNISVIFWSGDTERDAENIKIREATLQEKEYFMDSIEYAPDNEDYAAVVLDDGFEEWKRTKK